MGTVFFYTLRESFSRRMGLVMMALSAIVPVFLIFSMTIEKASNGTYLVSIGSQQVPAEMFVKFNWGAHMNFAQNLGTYMALFVSAALLSSYLEKGWADMLLTKGVARWQFMVGRIAGCVALFAAMLLMISAVPAIYFWARTGISARNLLLAIGVVIFNFLCLLSLLGLVSVFQPNVSLLVMTGFVQIMSSVALVNRKELVEFVNWPWLGPPLDFLYTVLPRTKDVNNLAGEILFNQTTNWTPFWWSAALAVIYTALACYALHRKSF